MADFSLPLFLLVVLAVYRLALLVAQDLLLDSFRKKIGRWAGGHLPRTFPWYVSELVNCPYCTGVWFALAGAFYLARAWHLDFLTSLVLWLALAGAQAFLFSLGGR